MLCIERSLTRSYHINCIQNFSTYISGSLCCALLSGNDLYHQNKLRREQSATEQAKKLVALLLPMLSPQTKRFLVIHLHIYIIKIWPSEINKMELSYLSLYCFALTKVWRQRNIETSYACLNTTEKNVKRNLF